MLELLLAVHRSCPKIFSYFDILRYFDVYLKKHAHPYPLIA